jgi:hypothetical protein
VERGQLDVVLERLDDLVVDEDGAREALAAVDDAVADGADLLDARQRRGVALGEEGDGQRQAGRMVGDGLGTPDGPGRPLLGDLALGLADALDEALREDVALGHGVELVLDRGAAAVDDEDLHGTSLGRRTPSSPEPGSR